MTGAGGRLLVRTALDADAVRLDVSDAGPPVDDAVQARMFEPFFTTKPAGLGMGLAISRSIAEAHGGRLWASRNAGRGLHTLDSGGGWSMGSLDSKDFVLTRHAEHMLFDRGARRRS